MAEQIGRPALEVLPGGLEQSGAISHEGDVAASLTQPGSEPATGARQLAGLEDRRRTRWAGDWAEVNLVIVTDPEVDAAFEQWWNRYGDPEPRRWRGLNRRVWDRWRMAKLRAACAFYDGWYRYPAGVQRRRDA